MEEQNRLYVFGYGSILWSQNFVYTQCWVAHLDGYKRRFLLGSTISRGCEECPGRAATLIPSPTVCFFLHICFRCTIKKMDYFSIVYSKFFFS